MATTALKGLHELLLQLEEVQEKIARGPRVVAVHRRKAVELEASLAADRAALLELRKSGDAKSLQMKTNEAKIVALKVKLNQASTNIEFDTFKGQIEADEMANSVLEDDILETFEKIDTALEAIAAAEQRLEDQLAEAEAAANRVAAAEEGLRSEAAAFETAIAEAQACVPPPLREQYRRLIAAHGAGALAAVEGKVCSACYVELEPQLRLEVKSGKPIFCRNCGRLMYQGDELDEG